ncbi:hypothetical protein GCM10008986_28810 [Salinibacillus aidingensis]|uniref:DUF4129 domain-containing protein n=1 Tax=Salinibacillus aidingensis TaxID=237684 RepID=A0ABN1BKT6_9BACI
MDKWNSLLLFLQQTLVIYLIGVPVLYLLNEFLPLPEYLLMVFLIGFVLIEMRQRVKTYAPYILTVPVVILFCTQLLKLSWFSSIVLALTLILLFIHQLKEGSFENEKNVLLITFSLAVIEVLIFSRPEVIWVAVLQFFLLYAGFYVRQYTSIQRHTAEDVPVQQVMKLPGLLGIIFLSMGLLVFMVFTPVRAVFRLMLEGVAVMLTAVLQFIGLGIDLTGITELEVEDSEQSSMNTLNEDMNQNQYQFVNDGAASVINQSVNVLLWIGMILLFIVAILLAKKFFGRELVGYQPKQNPSDVEYILESSENDRLRTSLLKRFSRKPNHQARRLFFQFEQFAIKHGFGRKPHETIENWFTRIDLPLSSVDTYQKVRYGEEETTPREVKRLKKELDKKKQELMNREKKKEDDQ